MQWIAGSRTLRRLASDRRDEARRGGTALAGDGERSERLSLTPASTILTRCPTECRIAFHYRPRDAGTLGRQRCGPAQPQPCRLWRGRPGRARLCLAIGKERGTHSGSDQEARGRTERWPPRRRRHRGARRGPEDAMIARSLAALDTAAASMRAPRANPPTRRPPAAGGRPRKRRASLGRGAARPPATLRPPPRRHRRCETLRFRARPRRSPPIAWKPCLSRSRP